jgi:hypothetical protein
VTGVDDREEDGSARRTLVRTGKEPVLSSERYGPHLIVDGVVIELNVGMRQKHRQCRPSSKSILASFL